MSEHNFGPASTSETIVFGARRPGQTHAVSRQETLEWIAYIQQQGIRRVCCLLPNCQLAYYAFDLLKLYRDTFGEANVCWAPVKDFTLADREVLLGQILPFLDRSEALGNKTVVHCAGGIGRTGQVMAAWLVHGRGLPVDEALRAVMETGATRNPLEAVQERQVSEEDLRALLLACRK